MPTPFIFNFNQIFQDHWDRNQKVWKHNRGTTVGASEVFDCIRKIGAEKRHQEWGLKPDEDYDEDWGAMERGNLIENHFIVPALRHCLPEETKALYVGDEQETLVKGKNSATPDGLITGLPTDVPWLIRAGDFEIEITDTTAGCFYLELKSIDPRANLTEEKAKHFGQTQVGLHLVRELSEYRPRHAIILYVDASFLTDINAFVVEYDPNIFKAAQGRATEVFSVKKFMDLAAEGKLEDACKYCRWKKECGEAIVKDVVERQGQNAPPDAVLKLEPYVKDALAKKAAVAEAEKELNLSRAEVKKILKDLSTTSVKGLEWGVNLSYSQGKKTVDLDAMREDGIDVSKYEKKGSPYEVLTILPKRGTKD